jgi:hypothetical protein
LIDELVFNATVATAGQLDQGCRFLDRQFLRAIHEGAISILREEIRDLILRAYHSMGAANGKIEAVSAQVPNSNGRAVATNAAQDRIITAGPKIAAAKQELLKFLSSEAL